MIANRAKLVQTIVELRGRGETYKAIGDKLGLSEEKVRGLYRRRDAVEKPGPEEKKAAETPPEVVLDGNKGYIATGPIDVATPDFRALLIHFGFNPDEFEILEPVNVRTWDAAVGDGKVRRMWYHRANIVRRSAATGIDVEDLVDWVRTHAVFERPQPTPSERTFVAVIADPQFGKADGGGTQNVVERFDRTVTAAVHRLNALRAEGALIDEVVLVFIGDGIENTKGHYAMQTFRVDLNRREQERVCRECYWSAIERFLPFTSRLRTVFVPGNHPENRDESGKAYTDFSDNFDLAVADQLRMVCDAAGYEVEFNLPADPQEMTVVIEASGTKLGVAHGHQMKSGGGPEKAVQNWWEGQMIGRNPIGEADILVTGHLHHLIFKEVAGRYWFQAPALENRSDWVKQTMGNPGDPGLLTFTTADGKWADLEVMR